MNQSLFIELEAVALCAFFGEAGGQALSDAGGYEAGDVAAQPAGPADDVDMPVGDGIEGTRIYCDARLGHLPAPVSSSASSSARWATETTRSPPATLNSTTPWVLRPTMRMSCTGQRMSCPPSVTSMIWSASATGKLATTSPLRSDRSILAMPCPPRPVIRYSKAEERLP